MPPDAPGTAPVASPARLAAGGNLLLEYAGRTAQSVVGPVTGHPEPARREPHLFGELITKNELLGKVRESGAIPRVAASR